MNSLQFLSYSQTNEAPNSAGKGNPTLSHLNRRPTCIFWLCLSVFPDLIKKIQMPRDKLKWEHNALREYLWDVDIQI